MKKFGFITILVRDYNEAVSFYTGKLGFVKLSDVTFGPGMRWITVAPMETSETAIIFVKADTAEKAAAVGRQAPGHVLLTVETSHLDRDYQKMQEQGVKFLGRPEPVPWGKEVVFEDLYGNLFDLMERDGQGA